MTEFKLKEAKVSPKVCDQSNTVHCKKELAVFPSPAGMSLIKLFLGGNNLVFSRPERVWSVTSLLVTGKWLTLFYSVATVTCIFPLTTTFNNHYLRTCLSVSPP
jgi:hypothetical protein